MGEFDWEGWPHGPGLDALLRYDEALLGSSVAYWFVSKPFIQGSPSLNSGGSLGFQTIFPLIKYYLGCSVYLTCV